LTTSRGNAATVTGEVGKLKPGVKFSDNVVYQKLLKSVYF